MNIKKISLFLLAVIMIFTLAACKADPIVEEENDNGNNTNVEEPAPEEKETTTINLYFANQEYIMTGDESLDHVIEVKREVELGEKSVEEVVLEELKKKPEDENLVTIVEKIKVLDVETKENIAYVNLSSENLNGGSMEEMLILNQIVFSLTDIEGVEGVQFLVDGQKRETLMGHTVIEEPIKRPDAE